MNSSTTRFSILVLSCFITIWHIFTVQQSKMSRTSPPVTKETNRLRSDLKTEQDPTVDRLVEKDRIEEKYIQESFEIPVDFCWSTEPIDVVYLTDNDLAESDENWNADLFKASLKGISLYLPWIRTIHVFPNQSRKGLKVGVAFSLFGRLNEKSSVKPRKAQYLKAKEMSLFMQMIYFQM